jgi:hypothetical protein
MKTALLAGLASVVLAGGALAAREAKMHVLSVALPDGSVEQIHYSGDVAPQIILAPAAAPMMPADFFASAFGPDSPFAEMERISAEMGRQSEAMLRQVAAMAAQQPAAGGNVTPAAFANMPAGTFHYTMVSTSSGAGTCTQSVQVTSMGEGQQPKVTNSSSGDCTAMNNAGPKAAALPPAAAPAPKPVKPAVYKPTKAPTARADQPNV